MTNQTSKELFDKTLQDYEQNCDIYRSQMEKMRAELESQSNLIDEE